MEFLRFGSSIPGAYWGCCAMDIIQNMKVNPDKKRAIQIIDGDSGMPVNGQYYGTTYRGIFESRILAGTFSGRLMPNHGFLAILTDGQLSGGVGKQWLKILEEHGFEFIRTVDNSVYSGASIIDKAGQGTTSHHGNHLFGLFRNIGTGAVTDPAKTPGAFKSKVPQAVDFMTADQRMELKLAQQEYQLKTYGAGKKLKTYTLEQLYAAGLTDSDIEMAGTQMRGHYTNPRHQEPRNLRHAAVPSQCAPASKPKVAKADPFAAKAAVA